MSEVWTQTDRVLELLKQNGKEGLTSLEALQKVGTMRLAARISDLRNRGYIITTYNERRGRAVVARYVLREDLTLW